VFAVLSNGRSLRSKGSSRPAPSSEPVSNEPLGALEARTLILRGHGWDGMKVFGLLDLSGDTRLTDLPARLECDTLNLSGCTRLEYVGDGLKVRVLDVTGCVNLKSLPEDTVVQGWCELANSGLERVPQTLKNRLRWQGMRIDERVALHPDQLTGQEILETPNLELRRILLERIGLEKLVSDVGGLILNRDRDAGGERKLVRIPLEDDEDIVAVCLLCPSTGGQYVIRVPPWTRTCREAVAWIAGFEDPDDYQPTLEA
jgi:hypothetical protein